jgi:hypothetical protein
VLILSLGMLTLFTIVAITLASISRTQSTAAANFKRAEQYGRQNAGVRPEQVEDLFRYAVNQLIYDTRNPQSAIRGHSLLRDMYGSPETYEATRTTAGTPPVTITFPSLLTEVEGNGAELRFRKDDLKGLYGLLQNASTDGDPRLHYQGVYNGTGLPLPTKLITSGGTPPTLLGTRLTTAEIARQFAFPHMPVSVVPFGKTNLPIGSNQFWQAMTSYPTPTLSGTNVGYWFPRFTLNYTVFDRFVGGSVFNVQRFRQETSTYPDGSMIMPERFFFGTNITSIPSRYAGHHWFGADEDYDYPDINNMYLALERADGRTLIPSFHRPGILGQVAAGLVPLAALDGTTITPSARMTNVNQIPWLRTDEMIQGNIPTDIRALVLRPRASDYDPATLGITSPKAGRFKEMADSFARPNPSGPIVAGQDGLPDDLDGSGFVGDHPSELDVDTDGDGLNDAIWIDLGYRPVQVGDAIIKPLFAFKVLDLDGKLNLNVHGNMYRLALNDPTNTSGRANVLMQHSSHRGASVTEINPMHGLIIGDTSTNITDVANQGAPIRPRWLHNPSAARSPADVNGVSPALSSFNNSPTHPYPYPHPYQRLLEGFTDAAGNYHPGRWSSPARDATIPATPGRAVYDDNGNASPNSASYAEGTFAGVDRVRTTLHSAGDGRAVLGSNGATPPLVNVLPAVGIPATASPRDLADQVGLGRTLSPFSKRALDLSDPSSTAPGISAIWPTAKVLSNLVSSDADNNGDDGNLAPLFINHQAVMGTDITSALGANNWGISFGIFSSLMGFSATQVQERNVPSDLFTFEEALEVNPYNPLENEDFFYSAADLAALWRAGDIDGPSSGSRLTAILSSQVVSPTTDISATSASATAPGYTQIEYARKRQQRMFTHASWDLDRFSSPPGVGMASIGTLWGGSVPRGVQEVIESVLQSTPGANNGVLQELSRKHSASGVPSILTDQLTYLLPNASGTSLLTTVTPGFGTGPYAGATENARRALETLATRRTIDTRDFLIPYEVQMGRRFDLNRPMMAYALPTFSASSKLLRLPATGAGSTTPPYDSATGTDPTIVSPDLVDLERQAMAQQLYVLLSIAAGLVGDNNPNVSGANVPLIDTKLRIAQARVLAQIAVNIVDYMDPDSVMTQMVFDPYLADGWGDNTDSPTPISSTNLPAYPRLGNGTIDPAFASAPPADQWRGTCTVIGFELPDLVINETISLVQENIVEPPPGPPPQPDPTRHEVLNTWVELMNPWPGTPDPVSPLTSSGQVVRGIRLYDPALGQPRFMVGVTNQACGILPRLVTPTLTDVDPKYRELVRFDVAGTTTGQSTDGYFLPGAVAEPFVASRDGANRSPADTLTTGDYGYFVIGPDTNSNIESLTNPAQSKYAENTPKIGGDWNPTDANTLSTTQDYAATACGQVLPQSSDSAGGPADMVVEVKLYRVRNPFRAFDAIENPYIVIDTVRMDAANRPTVEPFFERTGPTANPTSETPTASSYPGIYYAQDRTPPTSPPNISKVPTWATGGQPEAGRYSWQRRQPWHGWNSDWDPYQLNNPTVAATHPLVDSRGASGGLSARPMNAEGLFLGLPSLALAKNTTETMKFNALRQNGFIPATPTFTKSTAGGNPTRRTLNGTAAGSGLQDLKRWQTIPFANRQLATPLELLNVRLYGSHFWELPGAANIREWRLRFTDDFEFFTHAYAMPDSSGSMAANPFFERTWRSRQIPWFTSDRVTHPTWGDSAATFNFATGFNPQAGTLGPQLAAKNQVQLPLGNLYRFFELVECRSRLNNGKRPGEQWYGDTIAAPPLVPNTAGGNVVRSAREDRVAGKINLNTITEEEVLQGLIDSVSAMYFDPAEYVQMVTGYTSGTGISGATASMLGYWPTDYWTGLFTPLGAYPLNDPSVGATFDMMGDLIPLAGVDLSGNQVNGLSFSASNAPSTMTPPGGASVTNRISFEGGANLIAFEGASPVLLSSTFNLPNPTPLVRLINDQWPGLVTGPLAGVFPGTRADSQVSSEMYRTFLLSRAGADGITGTADDRPFRSFGAADVEDTILRSRSPQTTGIYEPPTITINMTDGSVIDLASDRGVAIDRTLLDGVEDAMPLSTGSPLLVSMGTFITRLGGQVTPRLFDPIPSPYADVASSAVQNLLYVGADPSFVEFNTQRPPLDKTGGSATYQPTTLPVDYWMLDEKRNSILAKIGGNTTTRSHVFAVWVTVGFFRVEPGTENLKVPLLGAEVGSETGRAKRHRAFFIVDRSQATEYEPEDIDANFDLDRLRNRRVLEFYKIIE